MLAGMGQILFAIIITVVISVLLFILSKTKFGEQKTEEKKLKITIPEDLEYNNAFNDIFEKYSNLAVLEKVRTTNMGSLFELTYRVIEKDIKKEKELIDELRCRNGNLNITLIRNISNDNEL